MFAKEKSSPCKNDSLKEEGDKDKEEESEEEEESDSVDNWYIVWITIINERG